MFKKMESYLTKFFLIFFICTAFSVPAVIAAEQGSDLVVSDAAICIDVVDLQCQGQDDKFSSQLGKLYCFTRIVGAQAPVTITHAWYYGHVERARVELRVGSANWRTYSSKLIQAHEVGPWHVDILGPDGELLRTIHFQIVP